jgi:glucose/arabinose dehydrogenase
VGLTAIQRFTVSKRDPNMADPDSGSFIFTRVQPDITHNGGQIAFGPQGYFYIGLGDGGNEMDPWNNAQNPQSLLGKILRVDVDSVTPPYSIPDDNPVYTVNPELAPEVWAWGLRNPWRFSFDSLTGDLYIGDVGTTDWEEINFQAADSPGGENYGWRIMQGYDTFSGETDPGMTVFPAFVYTHEQDCVVVGGYVYRGEALPELQGLYFFGDWCSGRIWAMYRDEADSWQTMLFMEDTGLSISSFGLDEAGELYVVDYGGAILKLVAA